MESVPNEAENVQLIMLCFLTWLLIVMNWGSI